MAMADLEESLDYAQNFHSFETPKENEKHDVLKGSDFAVVTERERDIILDAFALLGGNENLVSQILDRLQETSFSSPEEEFLRTALGRLWSRSNDSEEWLLSQGSLLAQLSAIHQERFHRLLSRALLYCGQYPNTRVYSSATNSSYHLLIISMDKLIGSDLPIGHTFSGQPCYRLAILFHWTSGYNNKWTEQTEHGEEIRPRRVRTISSSLQLEIKMLNITDMFAILPCP